MHERPPTATLRIDGSDWDQIADLTGDPSWRAEAMWKHFQRLENCRHRRDERWQRFGMDPTRHGWSGWLPTEKPVSRDAIADDQARRVIARSIGSMLKEFGGPSLARLEALGDPNDWRVVERDEIGARYTPLTTDHHRRVGTRAAAWIAEAVNCRPIAGDSWSIRTETGRPPLTSRQTR